MIVLSPKKVGESVQISLNVAKLTPSPTSPLFVVRHLRGVDDPYPEYMITEVASVSGTWASNLLTGGVAGATYVIEVWFSSGDERFCEELELTVVT